MVAYKIYQDLFTDFARIAVSLNKKLRKTNSKAPGKEDWGAQIIGRRRTAAESL